MNFSEYCLLRESDSKLLQDFNKLEQEFKIAAGNLFVKAHQTGDHVAFQRIMDVAQKMGWKINDSYKQMDNSVKHSGSQQSMDDQQQGNSKDDENTLTYKYRNLAKNGGPIDENTVKNLVDSLRKYGYVPKKFSDLGQLYNFAKNNNYSLTDVIHVQNTNEISPRMIINKWYAPVLVNQSNPERTYIIPGIADITYR